MGGTVAADGEHQMLATLLTEGFACHATESERFAGELEAAVAEARETPGQLARFVRVGVHTTGEHLRDWNRARRLSEAALTGVVPSAETAGAWAYLSVARQLAGDPVGAAEAEVAWMGSAPDGVAAAAVRLKLLLVGSGGTDDAEPLYLAAIDLARRSDASGLAEVGSQVSSALATNLLEAPSRTLAEAALMRLAANVNHEFCRRSGDWYADQCGHYLEALVANVDGAPDKALGHVEAATALIEANGGSPIDEAFLHLTVAHARYLRGEAAAAAEALARSDAIAATFDKPGLLAWHADERARVFPDPPPRIAQTEAP